MFKKFVLFLFGFLFFIGCDSTLGPSRYGYLDVELGCDYETNGYSSLTLTDSDFCHIIYENHEFPYSFTYESDLQPSEEIHWSHFYISPEFTDTITTEQSGTNSFVVTEENIGDTLQVYGKIHPGTTTIVRKWIIIE